VRLTPNLVEEFDAQVLFEVAYLRGDRWLAEMQLLSCAYKTTMFCNDLKGGELVQIECTRLHESPPTIISLVLKSISSITGEKIR
jgi:hypothetical protein